MRVAHWSLKNNSGMHRVAESMAAAERLKGIDAMHVDCAYCSDEWEASLGADVHVVHTHLPNEIQRKIKGTKARIVWIGHGTPDHVFQSAVEAGAGAPYGHPDHLMLMQYWLRNADARVTFWPRHQWIYQTLVDKGITIDCVPMGIDRAHWSGGVSRGKYEGSPSVLTGENPHYIKWPYDLFVAWKHVFDQLDGAKLHAIYVPRDMHRWFFPLVNGNGCAYASHISPITFPPDELPNVFKSVDYYVGLVRYGDFNHMGLQAAVAGAGTISYRGNEYADYWVTEGDQRMLVTELTAILKGEVEPRAKTAVPDITDTANAMKAIYERIAA